MSQPQNDGHPLLEVIVSSLSDAIEAERGGADRLELVRDLDRGGLTPDFSLVREIAHAVPLPLRVMLREDEDDSARGDDARLRDIALDLEQIRVDGLVIGFLRGGNVDVERTMGILEAVPQLRATFHHAFDQAASPLNEIALLKQCGRIDRILSSGGPGDLAVRSTRLERYRKEAQGEIEILAGGNLDEASIRLLRSHTGICEFHVGRAARSPHRNSGVVREECVRRLRNLLSCNDRPVSGSFAWEGRVNE